MILRIVSAFILALALAACGKGEPNPDKLARDITKNAKGAYSDYSGKKIDSLTRVESDGASGELTLRLRKWMCFGGKEGKCGRLRVPVEYVLYPEYVDPGSVGRPAPDAGKGEIGNAIEFSCRAGGPPCLEFVRIGGFGGYKTCEERPEKRSCDPLKGAQSFVESVAGKTGERVAMGLAGIQTIECAGEKKCAAVEAAFRELVEFAAGPSEAVEQEGDEEGTASVTSLIAGGELDVLELVNAANKDALYRAKSDDGKSYGVYQLKQIDFGHLADGRYTATLAACREKKKNDCAKPSKFKTGVYSWSLADIDPHRLKFLHASPGGDLIDTAKPDYDSSSPAPGSTFAVALLCKENAPCIKSSFKKKKEPLVVLPCTSPSDCKVALFLLAPERLDDGAEGQGGAASSLDKELNTLIVEIDNATRDAVYAEEPLAEGGSVSYAAGRGVGVAAKVFYKDATARIGPDGRLRIATRFYPSKDGEPSDFINDWRRHLLRVDLDKLDPASIAAYGDYIRRRGGYEDKISGWAVFAACRGGDETTCAKIPGMNSQGFDIFIPCTDERRCKQAAKALSKLADLAATDEFRSWREAREKAASAPTVIETRKGAKGAVKRISENLSGGAYRIYVSNMNESFLITPAHAALNDDNTLSFSLAYCRIKGRHTEPLRISPCWEPFAPELEAVDTVTLSDIDAAQIEIVELTSASDAIVVHLPCLAERQCRTMPIEEGPLWSTGVYVPCKDLEACAALSRDMAGLALWARAARKNETDGNASKLMCADGVDVKECDEWQALWAEIQKQASSNQDEQRHRSPGAARLVAEIDTASRGAQHKEYHEDTSEFVLWKAQGLALAPDGRLQVDLATCSYKDEADDSSIFQEYKPDDDGAGYWGGYRPNDDDYVDYWNPRKKDDASPCAKAQDWTSARFIVTPGDLEDFFGPHIHSYDEKGSRKEGFDAAASSFSVIVSCWEECIEVSNGQRWESLDIPCKDEVGCDKIADNIFELMIADLPDAEGQDAGASSGGRTANDLVGVWAFESPFGERIRIEFRADGAFIHTHPSNTFQGTYVASNGTYSIDAPAGNYADNGTYRLLDNDTVEFDGKFGRSVWRRQ